jgi:acetoin utilization deacetylase AcuC-like enzyme
MQVFYTPRYYAQIGEGHVFPIRKFELVRDRLLAEGTLQPSEIVEPSPASREDVLLVHTEDYVSRLCDGRLTPKELRRLGLPWSESLVHRSFYARHLRKAIAQTSQAARITLSPNVAKGFASSTTSLLRFVQHAPES